MTNYGGFGGLRFPAPAVVSAADLDPGHTAILGLLEAAINDELGDAWRGIVGGLGSGHYLAQATEIKPVGTPSTFELTPQLMSQFQAQWPVLAVYREGNPKLEWSSTQYRHWIQEWSVDYAIGPLQAAHIPRVGRFVIAVGRLIDNVIVNGYHPAYQNGARQFYGQFASLEPIAITGPGIAQSLTDGEPGGYYGLTVTLRSIERRVETGYANASTFETYTGHVPVGTQTDTTMAEQYLTVTIENGS